MASRPDVSRARLCENLKSVAQVTPEEIAAPTRAIVQRVLADFATNALMIRDEALNLPLACNLENHNPNSIVTSFAVNR